MNILYISSKKRWGGVSSWMQRTALALELRGHHVYILAHPEGRFAATASGELRLVSQKLGMDYNPLVIWFLVRFIRENNVHLVVTNIEKEVIAGGIAARLCRIPNVRRVGREDDFNKKFKVKMHHRFLVDRCIVPCDLVRDNAVKRAPWLDGSQCTTIYNGKNLKSFSKTVIADQRKEWGLTDGKIVIGVTTQLSRQKNVKGLVRVFKRLRERYQNIALVITGEGNEKETLRKMVRDAQMDPWVVFSGFAEDPLQVASAYDIAVSNSDFEGFPNTVVEYFAAGRPVVTTDAGGVDEMLKDRENGILVPTGDDDLLYDGIALLIENDALRSKLAGNAMKTIEKGFSEDQMIDRLERFFRESISLK
jgi:glycosyltransferase involved in cell wall biosynthesis